MNEPKLLSSRKGKLTADDNSIILHYLLTESFDSDKNQEHSSVAGYTVDDQGRPTSASVIKLQASIPGQEPQRMSLPTNPKWGFMFTFRTDTPQTVTWNIQIDGSDINVTDTVSPGENTMEAKAASRR